MEYPPEWDLRALMLRQLLQIPYVKDLVKRLEREPYLRKVCGYGNRAPTEAHFSQMKRRIRAEGFRVIEAYLRREALGLRGSQPLTAVGLVQAACVDGTGLEAWSSRSLEDSKRGLGDPDARLGRGRNGFILGYRSLFLTDIEGFPLGHVEAPANVNEALLVEPLLDKLLGEDLELELLVGDSGFESIRVFDALDDRGMDNLIAWRRIHIARLGGLIGAYTYSHDDSSGEEGRGKAYKRASKAQKEMIPLIPILTPASNTKTRQNSQEQPKPIQRKSEKTNKPIIKFE